MRPATTSSDSPSWLTPPGGRWQGAATRVTAGGTVVGVAIPPTGQIGNSRIPATTPTTGLRSPLIQGPLVRRPRVRRLLVRRLPVRDLLVQGLLVRGPWVRDWPVRGPSTRGLSSRGLLDWRLLVRVLSVQCSPTRGLLVRGPSVGDRSVRVRLLLDQKAVSGWRAGLAPEPGVRVVRGAGAGAFARVETEAVSAGRAGDALHVRAEVVPSTAAGVVLGEAAYVPGEDHLAEGLSVVGLRHREGRSCGWCPRPDLMPTTRRRLVEEYDLRARLDTQRSLETQRKLGDRQSPETRCFGRVRAVRRYLFATQTFGPVR